MIDERELIKSIEKNSYLILHGENVQENGMSLTDIKEAVNEQNKVGEWIPCNIENLPEKEVLCCDNHGEMILGYVFGDKASENGFSAEDGNEYMYNCVKWMEKPNP